MQATFAIVHNFPQAIVVSEQKTSPSFYGGEGQWTPDVTEAHAFQDLAELLQECGRHRITACKAVEMNVSGRLGLMLQRLA